MKSCITISLVPSLKGGPWVLWGNLEKCVRDAARLGFDSVELFTDGPQVENHKEFSILLEETGLSVGAVGTGAVFLRMMKDRCNQDHQPEWR